MIVLAGILMSLIFAGFDWHMITIRKVSPIHWLHWTVRFAIMIAFSLLIKSWSAVVPLYFIVYTLFDPALNLMRGKPFFYLGENNFWDRVFGSRPELLYLSRLILAVVFTYLYYRNAMIEFEKMIIT